MTDDMWSWYTSETTTLTKTYPVDQTKLNAGDFKEWAAESLNLAKTIVYPGK